MFNSIHVKRIILGAKIILIKFKLKKYRGHISVIIVTFSKLKGHRRSSRLALGRNKTGNL